jgi:hypothetical protein
MEKNGGSNGEVGENVVKITQSAGFAACVYAMRNGDYETSLRLQTLIRDRNRAAMKEGIVRHDVSLSPEDYERFLNSFPEDISEVFRDIRDEKVK